MQDTCMASGCTSDPHGLVRRQWLCNQLSTRREPGDRIPHSVLPLTESGLTQLMFTTDILATYATDELEELLQFLETKENRFQNLKRELKEELAIRTDIELWS